MSSLRRPLGNVHELIIHCSATPNGTWFNARDIDGWHADRGFLRGAEFRQDSLYHHIGYHYVIDLRGNIETGRRLDETGAHCLGHNEISIGICLIGSDQFTGSQWQSLANLTGMLQRIPGFNLERCLGHRDTSPNTNHNGRIEPGEYIKRCPGFNVSDWLAQDCKPLNEHLLERRG